MGFLRRLLGGSDDAAGVPEWASFFDAGEYRRFLDLVLADFRRRGIEPTLEDGAVTATLPGTDGPARFGLANLAQVCNGDDEARWPTLIAAHFDTLRATTGRDLDVLADDYEQAGPILRIRLMPDESMGGVPIAESVSRPVAPGILAVLVLDFPDSTATVPRDAVAAWPVDLDTAWHRALANLDGDPRPLRDDVSDERARFTIWYGDSFYVATRLLRLTDLLPPHTTDALVAVPNRHTLIAHVIEDATVVASMQALHRATVDLFRDGPGSISDQPYWWHEGELTPIPHQVVGKRVQVAPPDAFVRLLESVLERSDRG
jgi:hypothetical protein